MGWNRFKAEYLSFSRKERTGILSILALILIIYLIPLIHGYYSSPVPFRIDTSQLAFADTANDAEDDLILADDPASEQWTRYPYARKRAEVFPFDPNLATKEEWLRLGLSERTAATIHRYRSKGGRFYKKEDLQKIWGLPAGFYERVKEHIVIPGAERPSYPAYEKREYERKAYTPAMVSVNNADSSAFEKLPGIGAKLTGRIIAFREKLGGFYSIDQVGETYGLADSIFQKIRPFLSADPASVRKININTATKEELRSHPYIRWNLANAIVAYREQHGDFQTLGDLKKIAVIDDKTYEKLYWYLRIE